MGSIRIDGVDLYYEVHGNGFPVVFAHGVGGNHASWFRQVPAFASRYQVIVFDHRGFGNSRAPVEEPVQSKFVTDLGALLDHLDIGKAALVAQSMGGGTCAAFTARYPQRVAALVMCDSLLGLALPEPIQAQAAKVGETAENLSQLQRVLGRSFADREPELSYLYLALASFNTVTRKTLKGFLDEPCTLDRLSATGVPVLFVVGQEDVLFPPDLVFATHKLVGGSRYLELPKAGHSGYFEAPDAFNAAVLRFLGEVLR